MGPKTRRLLKWMFELEVEMFDMFGDFMVKEGETSSTRRYEQSIVSLYWVLLGGSRWDVFLRELV